MPLETTARIVQELAERGYNADREAVTLLASAPDPEHAIDRAVEMAPDDVIVLSAAHVRETLEDATSGAATGETGGSPPTPTTPDEPGDNDPSISSGTSLEESRDSGGKPPVETEGSSPADSGAVSAESGTHSVEPSTRSPGVTASQTSSRDPSPPETSGDIKSIGTGEYRDFVSVFRDRYEKLASMLRGRVNHRPAASLASASDGTDAGLVGMVSDLRTTKNGHWLVELEDTSGTFPCLILKDREFADEARELLYDEVIAVSGSVSNDGVNDDGIMFVDDLYFPDVPRTYSRSQADRHVEAALISDVHVGSQEFLEDAWQRFADWLHTEEAKRIEYLLIAGDMVEGVGVYPNQDEELDIIDIYDQYEQFSEHLKDVPGDIEIVMIPGNHDAVRLAEPQPAFDEELRDIMSAHDARIAANPSTVTIEGVSVLMYHGVSLDELIAELPEEAASYDRPQDAMARLLKKRHVAPQYGGMTRIAPEPEDHLVIDEVPDIFHTGHVHKLGYGTYHNVLTINSSCWQSQTDFQKSVNLNPDVAYAPIVRLDTFDLTIRHFE